MKTNAPEKIYIFENPILDFTKLSVRQSDTDIEYTRTDAFIEKAAKWLDEKANDYACIGYAPYYDLAGNERERPFAQMSDSFINDFKKAMKL